ncbi:MAG: lysophospholipid acyltransferase family protein [Pirellulales bacterium]|nr:1-acyl-sn-glycerol-3-phosphate acyltransferase [Planctomycetales bacterium]
MLSDNLLEWLAVGVPLLWVLSIIAALAWEYGKTRYTLPQFPIWVVYLFYTRIVWRARVIGGFHVPENEGAIIVSNHVSSIDPLFIQLTTNRVVRWMVAREYSQDPMLKWIFDILGSITVNRGGVDAAATKRALRLAQQGEKVGLFPEGRINVTDDLLLPGRPGVAMIALRARVPVIPCFVFDAPYDGTPLGCFLMAAHTTVVIGEPIDLSAFYGREGDREALVEVTKIVLTEIARLSGQTGYVPKIAGRRWNPWLKATG